MALPFVFTSKEARFPGLGKRALFVSGLVDWRRRYALSAILSSGGGVWLWRLFRGLRRRFLRVRLRSVLHRPCSRACRRSYLLACRCSCSPAWWSLAGYFCRSRASRRAVSPRPVALSWRVLSSRRVSLSRARWPCLPRPLHLHMPCRRRHRPLAPFPNRRGAHFAWQCPRRSGL